VALWIGLAALGLALSKLWVLRRVLAVPLAGSVLIGAGLLLAWNFLAAPLLALLVAGRQPFDEQLLRSAWSVGGLPLWLAAACLWIGMARGAQPAASRPFMRSLRMAWLFVALLIVAASVHQHALAFVFSLKHYPGDLLGIGTLACLILFELLHQLGFRQLWLRAVLWAAPLLAATVIALNRAHAVGDGSLADLPAAPMTAVVLGAAGLGMLVWRLRLRSWVGVPIGYGLWCVLFWDYDGAGWSHLQWQAFRMTAASLLLAFAWARWRPGWAVAAALLLAFEAGVWADAHHAPWISPVHAAGLAAGGGLSILGLIFGPLLSRRLLTCGAVVGAVAAATALPVGSGSAWVLGTGWALLGAAVAWRTGERCPGLLHGAPFSASRQSDGSGSDLRVRTRSRPEGERGGSWTS